MANGRRGASVGGLSVSIPAVKNRQLQLGCVCGVFIPTKVPDVRIPAVRRGVGRGFLREYAGVRHRRIGIGRIPSAAAGRADIVARAITRQGDELVGCADEQIAAVVAAVPAIHHTGGISRANSCLLCPANQTADKRIVANTIDIRTGVRIRNADGEVAFPKQTTRQAAQEGLIPAAAANPPGGIGRGNERVFSHLPD